jgi:hypothetical protein
MGRQAHRQKHGGDAVMKGYNPKSNPVRRSDDHVVEEPVMKLPAFRFNRGHFRDTPRLWCEGDDDHNPKCYDEIVEIRKAAIERLRRAGGQFLISMRRLGGCRRGRRCLSAACSVCTFALRRWCVENVPDGASFYITIIDSNAAPRLGNLQLYDLGKFYELVARQLLIANVKAAIGAVHFDVIQLASEAYWQPHLHILAWAKDSKSIRSALKASWKNTSSVYAAVDVRSFNGDLRALAYATDTRHKRKIQQEIGLRNGSTRVRTKKIVLLESKHRTELDAYLNEMTVWQRLFVLGFEIEAEAPM